MQNTHRADIAIIGGGIAGIVAALHLIDHNHRVILLDRNSEEHFGGLAPTSFGGMALVGTPLQQKKKIHDTPELALRDWHTFAEFGAEDYWPKQWAEYYVHHCLDDVYHWLTALGMQFMPAVNWVERGLYTPGNSVPRYHVLWGTGYGLMKTIIEQLNAHPKRKNLQLCFHHRVTELTRSPEGITGCQGVLETDNSPFEVSANAVIVASGGISGNIEKLKSHWPAEPVPEIILNGTHPYCDGALHTATAAQGGKITHLDKMWNYAAGIAHPQPRFDGHGLSLIPCKSALWLNAEGRRIGPEPLVTGFDTHQLCQIVATQPLSYTWQILNRRIALKELAISGSEHNPMIRDKKTASFMKELLLGNHRLVNQMKAESADFITADTLPELVQKMNAHTGNQAVQLPVIQEEIAQFDRNFDRPSSQYNDAQIRRIQHARAWFPDRLRTAKPGKIIDGSELIAIRLRLISRKTLGGIVTDLHSRVLADNTPDAAVIQGLYAVGECAGFGGGGANGLRSLEGTFLSGCILTAKAAANHLNQ